MNITHFSSMSSHTTNTATVLRFVFIGTTPSAAFTNTLSLVGDGKRLRLRHFDVFSHKWQSPNHLILHTVANPPTEKLH